MKTVLQNSEPYKQAGVVLLSVLISTSIITIALSTMFYQNYLSVTGLSRQLAFEQALLLGLSSESWWRQSLDQDLAESSTDNLNETWSFPSPALPVEGGVMAACVIDLQGRLNVNNLLGYSSKLLNAELQQAVNVGTAMLIARALTQLDQADASQRVAKLHDWLDLDSDVNLLGGAEDPDYLNQTIPRMAANNPLAHLDEISLVDGFSDLSLKALKPYFSALPKATRINVNTAPAEVLGLLLDDQNSDFIQLILDQRPYEDTASFLQNLVNIGAADSLADAYKQLVDTKQIGVRSEFFQLNTSVEFADSRFILQSLIHRPFSGGSVVLQRKLIQLPKLVDSAGKPIEPLDICPSRDFQQMVKST